MKLDLKIGWKLLGDEQTEDPRDVELAQAVITREVTRCRNRIRRRLRWLGIPVDGEEIDRANVPGLTWTDPTENADG